VTEGQHQIVTGDLVEYLEDGVFDQMIVRGDTGVVTRVADGWVYAQWPRVAGDQSVPVEHVRLVARRSP
jgi:hypothetical protein